MQIIAAIGGLAFILTSLITGARMLMLWNRTRQLPEFVLGAGLFMMGGLGYPLTLLAEFGAFLPDGARSALVGANYLNTIFGQILVVFFTIRVFRPTSRWARGSLFVIAGLFAAIFVNHVVTHGVRPVALGGAHAPIAQTLLTVLCLGWAGLESFLYYLKLRRRRVIGLADPLLVNRILLWAIGMACAATITGVSAAFTALGIPFNQSTVGILTTGVMGTGCSLSVWFAFFGPGWYVRWVRSGAGPVDGHQVAA